MVAFPAPPLKFRTAGFPQYGFKPQHFRTSLPVSRLNVPSPILGYAVLLLPSPWAFARLIAGRPSPSRIDCRSPRVLRSARVIISTSLIATTTRSASLPRPADFAFRLIPQVFVRQTLPAFTVTPSVRAALPTPVSLLCFSRSLAPQFQASPPYHRVAAHMPASASNPKRVEFTALQGSLYAAARTFASHPGLAARCFVERALDGARHRASLRSRLDGRTGNLPSSGLSPDQS